MLEAFANLMVISEAFRLFDKYCRQGPFGGDDDDDETIRKGGLATRVGQTIFVSHWAFDEVEAQDVVCALAAESKRLSKSVVWRLYSGDRPNFLSDILSSAGFNTVSEETLLAFDLANTIKAPRHDAVRVRNSQQLDRYREITSRAFQERLDFPEARRATFLASDQVLSFISSDTDGLLTAGQMDLASDIPVVLLRGGSTVPEQRGKGGYSSLVSARLRLARDLKKRMAFVEAGPNSRPILRRMGFEEVSQANTWMLEPSWSMPAPAATNSTSPSCAASPRTR